MFPKPRISSVDFLEPSVQLADEESETAFTDEEEKAVETFSFDVSAGRKPKVAAVLEVTDAPLRSKRTVEQRRDEAVAAPVAKRRKEGAESEEERTVEKTKAPVTRKAGSAVAQPRSHTSGTKSKKKSNPVRSDTPKPKSITTKKQPPLEIKTDPKPKTRSAPRKRLRRAPRRATLPVKHAKRGKSSTLWSIGVHGMLFVMLGLWTITVPSEPPELQFSPSPVMFEDFDEYHDVEIDLTEELETMDEVLPSDLIDPGESALGDPAAGTTLADLVGDMGPAGDMIGNFGNLLGEDGNGLADVGEGLGGKALVSFFGTKGAGRRILYMLDNSGSMHSGRMEQLIAELILSVNDLHPEQEFYVVFYSDVVYPLGYPDAEQDFIKASQENKLRLRKWLQTVELCAGNAVDQAIRAVENIKPDIVFMLSDGDVRTTKTGRKYNLLLDSGDREFVLHTLGMGCEKQAHRDQLLAIAEAHGGTFREVEVDPSMFQRYRRGQRPYRTRHNPGPVWGKSLGEGSGWK